MDTLFEITTETKIYFTTAISIEGSAIKFIDKEDNGEVHIDKKHVLHFGLTHP